MTETARSCPICGNARAASQAPFCSQRCRDRDLARWFSDAYAVPGRAAPPEMFEGELPVRQGTDPSGG